jgi:hypothetical protein
MNRLVRESIVLEKFTDVDEDPIISMGIGGFSFESLKPGAIITAKVPRLSLKKGNDGYFTYPGKGIDLPIDYPLLVFGVRDYIIPGTKEIKIYKISKDLDEVKKSREIFKTEGKLSSMWGTDTRMIIPKKKFNRMFKVIEKGF